MATNHVKSLREKQGLTQKALAEKARTSQQQIQRIERGQLTRLDTALKIAGALDKPVEAVFPSMKAALKKLRSGSLERLDNDESLRAEFNKAGVDPDPKIWTFRFVLDNGVHKDVEVSSVVKSRLWSALQGQDELFAVFDGFEERFAINVSRLAFWQFLFDPGAITIELGNPTKKSNADDEEREPEVSIWLGDSKEPWPLHVEPDWNDFDPDDFSGSEMQGLFENLTLCLDKSDVFHVTDEDGETAFFRAEHVAMITATLTTVMPNLYWDDEDDANAA